MSWFPAVIIEYWVTMLAFYNMFPAYAAYGSLPVLNKSSISLNIRRFNPNVREFRVKIGLVSDFFTALFFYEKVMKKKFKKCHFQYIMNNYE